jgi:P63C domain
MSESTGKAKGGVARAAKLTPERRKEIGQKAADAKRELASLPQTTHIGTLKLIDVEIPCAVLEDGTRVLTQSDFMSAMGMYYSGWIANNMPSNQDIVSAEIPHFLAQKSLIPFINKHLGHLQNIVLKYKTEKGTLAHGIRAEIIPSICDIYLDAQNQGSLGSRQKQIADRAMLLMRALAHVGIVALVDEATGYQKEREKDALAKILEAFVAKEIQPYLKTFPAEYYEQLFKIYNLPYPPIGNKSWRPAFFGHITNDVVYSRLAPELLPELKKAATKAEKKSRLHQWLTNDLGHPKLREHLSSIVSILKLSKTPEDFKANVNIVHPRYGETGPLDFGKPTN